MNSGNHSMQDPVQGGTETDGPHHAELAKLRYALCAGALRHRIPRARFGTPTPPRYWVRSRQTNFVDSHRPAGLWLQFWHRVDQL